ncbi:hypothetical protein [Streptomyces sp. NPDC017949]|uniref:hypothetical protein n=1 Tax=Streptomyces sp. NPDC017949 TaxID=3365020 RepID=UPI00378A21D3
MRQHGGHGRYGALVVAAAAAALLAGCQSGGAAALSLSGLTGTADAVPAEGAAKCPLAFDIAKAAKAAGVDGDAAPGSAKDPGSPVATAEGGKRAEAGTPLAQNPGALVSCTFHIGQEDVVAHTAVTRQPTAVAPLAPIVRQTSGSSVDELKSYIDQVGKARIGEPVATGSGNVAAVRLELDGDGDAVLLLGAGSDGRSALNGKQVGALTKALAEQLG